MTDYEYDSDYMKELQWQEDKAEMEELERKITRYAAEKTAAQNQQEANKIFQDALEESGLTVEEFIGLTR